MASSSADSGLSRKPASGGEGEHSYRTVLCATDLSRIGDSAVRLAYALVASGGTVYLLHVFDPSQQVGFVAGEAGAPPTAREVMDAAERHAREHLARLPFGTMRPDVASKEIFLHHPHPASAIAQHARLHEVDVVVMGTHGRTGLGRLLMGSVATDVLKLVEVPVVLFHDPTVVDRR